MSSFKSVTSFSVLLWIISVYQVSCDDGEVLFGVSECEKTGRCPTRHGPMTGRSVPIHFNHQINALTNAVDSNPGMLINNFIETRLRRKSDDGNSFKKDTSGKGQRPTMLGPRPGRGFWPATRVNDDLDRLLNQTKLNPWIFISHHGTGNEKLPTQFIPKLNYQPNNLLFKYLMLKEEVNNLIDNQVNTQDRNR